MFLLANVFYLLVSEPHLPPRISRDIHATQKDSSLVAAIVQDGRVGLILGLKAFHQLGLDWGVILFVDNIIDAVTVNQQVFLQKTRQNTQTIKNVHIQNARKHPIYSQHFVAFVASMAYLAAVACVAFVTCVVFVAFIAIVACEACADFCINCI